MNIQLEIPQELKKEISALRDELSEIKLNLQPKEPPKYFTKKETAEFFKVDLSTIHNWTVKGILTPFQIGGRVYFRVKDIENALVELKK